MAFVKGQSGNPGGKKPIDPAFKKLLDSKQQWALEQLIKLAQYAEEPAIRLKAIQYLLDRGQGKPAQAINLGDADGEKFSIQVIVKQGEIK